MGEAAKISLKAIGKQDLHLLSKDPEDSFFKDKDMIRHSDFRKYHRSRNVINPGQISGWPFGQTIKVQFNPQNMGDLLSNMWLSITMPGLSDFGGGKNFADQLGRHILKSVTMFVDELEVEKIHDDWGIIYDELYLEMSEKVANRFLVNRSIGYDDSTLNDFDDYAQHSSDLVIPLHFFFSRKYASDEYSSNKPNRPYFPICAVHRQKIEFELEFHDQRFFTDTGTTLQLPEFKLITEEITVSPEERKFLATEPQTFVTDIVRKHPSIISDLNKDIIRNNLVPNIPVKCIHWFLRNTEFEDATDSTGGKALQEEKYYQNRFNFSSNVNFDEVQTFFYPIMSEASFYINGSKLPNVSNTTHNYYKYLIPFRNRLSRPIRNIYTYSFSMNPVNVEPSGNLDFSQIQSDKTSIEVKLDTTAGSLVDITTKTYSLNMYYTGYQTYIFDKGFMSLAY
jgi:hypothetical protein|tara:strand:+ start:2768 stop:4123 length:1356 start_codon:yes stop_codon:yes gene_type:complete